MPSPQVAPGSRGYIIPIGGAEDKMSGRLILKRFAELCGGASARICVIPTASQLADTGQRYTDVFRSLGVRQIDVLPYQGRPDTERLDWLETLGEATGIFLTGGSQLRLSTILGGTPVASLIRRLNARGVHVAGTSAGAAFVSEHMIAFGKEGATPIAGQVTLAPGLGLSNRVIVGLGLDEDTAAFINRDNVVEVVGSGGLTILDVSALEYSSMAQVDEGQPVQLVGVRLHVLSNGGTFDMDSRKAAPGPVGG
jgi:cyanophycinase